MPHFSPVGYPAPPRPRNPLRMTSSITSPRSQFRQRFHQRLVTAGRDVILNLLGINDTRIFEHDLLLAAEEGHIGRANQAGDRLSLQAIQNFRGIGSSHPLVHDIVADGNQWAFRAQSHAAHAFCLAMIAPTSFFYFLVEFVLHALALA